MRIPFLSFGRFSTAPSLRTTGARIGSLRSQMIDRLRSVSNTSDYPKKIVSDFSKIRSAVEAGKFSVATGRFAKLNDRVEFFARCQKGTMAGTISASLKETVKELDTLFKSGLANVHLEKSRLDGYLAFHGLIKNSRSHLGEIVSFQVATISLDLENKHHDLARLGVRFLKDIVREIESGNLGLGVSGNVKLILVQHVNEYLKAVDSVMGPSILFGPKTARDQLAGSPRIL